MIYPAAGLDREVECHSPNHSSWDSGRLWSLLDVIKQSIWRFVNAGMGMHNFQLVLDSLESREAKSLAEVFAGLESGKLNEKTQTNLALFLNDLKKLAVEFELPTSSVLLHMAVKDLPRTSREMNILLLAVRTEVHGKLFVFIPSERSDYFEMDGVLSDKAKEAFPNAYSELREGANCYAAERYTACVFHAMRAAEIGLRALAADVGVTFPDKPLELAEWQNLIEKSENKIKEIVNCSVRDDPQQAQRRDEDRKFYSEVAAQFRYFKDGWRIRASHARETYIGSQALNVLNHVRQFFEDLAVRLREPL